DNLGISKSAAWTDFTRTIFLLRSRRHSYVHLEMYLSLISHTQHARFNAADAGTRSEEYTTEHLQGASPAPRFICHARSRCHRLLLHLRPTLCPPRVHRRIQCAPLAGCVECRMRAGRCVASPACALPLVHHPALAPSTTLAPRLPRIPRPT
ncbi:hypothetical protein C8F04DRAFT_1293962, partial [Mycena alexandri]